MNFGEAFGFWYLRLNGFFPLTNFVLHRFRGGAGQNADCDVLAVRFPHVYELIGGKAEDWDNDRFQKWGLDHKKNTLGIIGEIKTGEYEYKKVNAAFNLDRLKYSVYRLGFFEKENVDSIARQLLETQSVTIGTFTVAKLFIHSEEFPPEPRKRKPRPESKPGITQMEEDASEIVPCLLLTVEEIEEFIKNRMQDYAEHKSGARMFFSGDLIQFFAWKGDAT
jgi:hypothetical protein